ncbi:unnamed protein product [Paramecium sonneborni]|uniref:Uncharacterized protein n=1 Tax=Paramecium sonneborni TaxID=65129 RepID=A0A8S1QZL9_9CILI|nr:unnamed protein product [Paramecium sonneborni]
MEESWNLDESEPKSPSKDLLDKYNSRLQAIELTKNKIKKFQLEQQLQRLRNWYEIKEHLLEIYKEANLIQSENLERRQQLIFQIRNRESQLKEKKKQIKEIKKQKQIGLFIKEQRTSKRQEISIQEIDELLIGIQAIKHYLQEKYKWQFPKKQMLDLSSDEFLDEIDVFKTDRIKFDFIENNIYHLDNSQQMHFEMQKSMKQHLNSVLDQSVRSYQSLSNSSKKEMLSLRFDKVTTRLPPIPKETQSQSQTTQQQLKSGIGLSKMLRYPLNSQTLASPKRRQQFGFVEDIIANSVSSRILTRKQTTNLTHQSEGESQRKDRRKMDVSVHSSQDRMLKIKNAQKMYYPDVKFDIIREVDAPIKQKKLPRRGLNQQQEIQRILNNVNETFQQVISNKAYSEHKFNKIRDLQKQFVKDANSSLSKISKYQLEEKLDDVWQTLVKDQKKKQPKLLDYYKKNHSSRLSAEVGDEKMLLHKDKLLQKIIEQVQLLMSNANQQTEADQQFYDGFKYVIAHQQISDMLSQVQMSSNIDQNRKIFSQQVFTKMSQILKNYSTQQYKVTIKINQQLYYLARDTIRTIQEAFEACQQVDKVQLCGKDASFKQYDKYIRQLDQLSFFWEQLHTLENKNITINKEMIQQEISQFLDQWLDTLIQRFDFKQISQKQQQTQQTKPVQATKVQQQVDHRLRNAHELFSGLGRERDQIAALQQYTKLAEENNPIAQAIMGQICLEGITGPKDYDQAFNYFKKSADQRNTFSLYHTSKLVLEGKVYDKFSDKDDNTLASKYSSEVYNRNYDCTFAMTLLKRAAELDHLESMIYLGDLYSNGLQLQDYTLEKDYSNAEFYYKQAKNKNSTQAMHKLALLYQTMYKQPLYKNRSQLIQPLLNQAKNLDYLPAFYDLGLLLYQGLQDEVQQNQVMADLIFEQGCMKGDLKCAQKLLSLRFQALRKNEIVFEDFFTLLEQIEENNKDWTITYYMRGKVYEKGVQIEKNLKKAQEQYRLGYLKGCQKCRAQLDKFQRDTIPTDNYPSNSQQSSINQRQNINGFIEQFRSSEQKKPFLKQRQVSNGNVQQISNNIDNDIQSIVQDRYTRMTISITRPKNETDDRKRGVSASELPLQDIGRSILLSQMKSPEKVHQHSQFWSPKLPSQQSQVGSQITNSTTKKRFNLKEIRKKNSEVYENVVK